MIGWKFRTSLLEGLRKTIEWHERNGKRWIWETKMGPEDQMWQDARKGGKIAPRGPQTSRTASGSRQEP